MSDAPRILVCGAGSIGRRHIDNLVRLGARVTVWRKRERLLDQLGSELSVSTEADLARAIAGAEAVVVATATDEHMPISLSVLRAGRALFVEKPLSHDWSGVEELRALAGDAVVEVGCQLRFHPNLIAIKRHLKSTDARVLTYRLAMGQRLDAWRPGTDYRASYSAAAARGGGALFDLIHMIDLALWLFGPVSSVSAVLDTVGDLGIVADDMANVLLTHQRGTSGHVQTDMVSPVHRCEAEITTRDGVIFWSNRAGTVVERDAERSDVLDEVPTGFERNDLFLSHMRHFLGRLRDPALKPACSLEDGIAALRVAIAARSAHGGGRSVALAEGSMR